MLQPKIGRGEIANRDLFGDQNKKMCIRRKQTAGDIRSYSGRKMNWSKTDHMISKKCEGGSILWAKFCRN